MEFEVKHSDYRAQIIIQYAHCLPSVVFFREVPGMSKVSSVLRDIMRTIVESTGLIYGLLARKMPATVLDLLSGSELEMISFLRSALI